MSRVALQGLGDWGLGIWVSGLGFQGPGFRLQRRREEEQGASARHSRFVFRVSGFSSVFRVSGLRFRVEAPVEVETTVRF